MFSLIFSHSLDGLPQDFLDGLKKVKNCLYIENSFLKFFLIRKLFQNRKQCFLFGLNNLYSSRVI